MPQSLAVPPRGQRPRICPLLSERSSRAGPGRGVAAILAPPHPPGRLLAWSTEMDRLGEAAAEPVRSAVRDDLGRSKPAAPGAPLWIRHGPLLPLSYGVGLGECNRSASQKSLEGRSRLIPVSVRP